MKIIDISQELLNCEIYDGDPSPKITRLTDMEAGDIYNLSALSLCVHNGTHIDAPKHFIKDGAAVDEIPLDTLIGRCFVACGHGNITAEDAEDIYARAESENAEKRILIKGDVTVTEAAARVFAEKRLLLLGNEGQTVGPKDSPMAVHLALLGAEVILLEGIVLEDVTEGVYLLNAAPLNIKGCEGSPCRAWLMEI
ncbi:MAG: cyclase family protein [Clostridia bacterium]|nr:cyclase family protein [Clostridia bacterium]